MVFVRVVARKGAACQYVGNHNGQETYVVSLPTNTDRIVVLQALAHEMIHVKQFLLGKLRDCGEFITWCGKPYSPDTPWLSMPWELDAMKRETLAYYQALAWLEENDA